MVKRNLRALIISAGLLTLLLAIALFATLGTHRVTHASSVDDKLATTINGLKRISVVGSTAFILNAKGQTIAVDPNPYGAAIVPANRQTSRPISH